MMTTHELYKKIATILTQKNTDELFDYIIHAMDYNGDFLRSRYCYWEDKTLPDKPIHKPIHTLLVALNFPFNFEQSVQYYLKEKEEYEDSILTDLQMQIFLYDLSNEERFMEDANWSASVGFPYPIRIDLVKNSFEVLDEITDIY